MIENKGASSPYSESDIIDRVPGRVQGRIAMALVSMSALGLIGFVLGLAYAPQRAWQAYLVNFLFFSGLAAAGVIFGAGMQVAKGHWGKPLHRIAQGFGAFLPVSWILFILLYLGHDLIFPWIGNPVNPDGHALPEAWFNVSGLFLRGTIFLGLLYAGCLAFMYYSLRPDVPAVSGKLSGWRRRLADWMSRGFRGPDEEAARSRRILGRLSVPLILGFVIILSGMAIDLIMGLTPGWLSVLFPAYFFIGAWLSALAGIALLAAVLRRHLDLDFFAASSWHDLGKLIFAFCIFWAYLWFSQFLPIWYGNLPRETLFIEARWQDPWTAWSVAFFVCVFLAPFVLLLWQKVKLMPAYLGSVGGLILVGFWLERFNMVVPSIWRESGVPFGWVEVLVTLGFVGLFGLCYALYTSTFPLVPLRDSLIIGRPRKGPY